MHPPYRGLALLLSLGVLPIACKDPDSGGTDGGTTGGGSTGGGTGTGDATTGVPTGSDSDSDSAATSTSGTTSGTGDSAGFITTNTTSSTSEGDTMMLPPVTDPTCIAYGDHLIACYPRYESYLQYYAYYCQYIKTYGLRTDGQGCVDALEAQFVCLTNVACGDFMTDPGPCTSEIAAVAVACPSLQGPDTGGSSDGSST